MTQSASVIHITVGSVPMPESFCYKFVSRNPAEKSLSRCIILSRIFSAISLAATTMPRVTNIRKSSSSDKNPKHFAFQESSPVNVHTMRHSIYIGTPALDSCRYHSGINVPMFCGIIYRDCTCISLHLRHN